MVLKINQFQENHLSIPFKANFKLKSILVKGETNSGP
jgi:hypothetical protein